MIEKTAAKYLGFVEQAAKKAGVACESIDVTSDYPDDAILKISRKKKCDLIVMANRMAKAGCAACSSAAPRRR